MRRIPARPTVYNGVRMRSRLEARFAGILDTLGLKWEYEGEAFASGPVQYVPDFTVDQCGEPLFIEVKPTMGGENCGPDDGGALVHALFGDAMCAYGLTIPRLSMDWSW